MTVRLRPAELTDLEDLLRLEEAAFPGDRTGRRAMRHAILSPSIDVTVMVADTALLGNCVVEFRRGATVGRLTSLAVVPGSDGRGHGRALVEEAEAAARLRGCDRVRLEVRADNGRAIGLYERAGYARIGEVPDYYEDGRAAVRFEKRLG